MLQKLKLQYKILLSSALPILVLFGAVGWGTFVTRDVSQNFTKVSLVANLTDKTHHLELGYLRRKANVRGYLISPKKRFLVGIQEAADFYKETLKILESEELSLANLENYFTGQDLTSIRQHRQRIEATIKLIKDYEQISSRLISLMQEGKKAEAQKLFSQQPGEDVVRAMNEVNLLLHEIYRTLVVDQERLIKESLGNLLWSLFFLGIILGGVAFMIAWWISRNIHQTINRSVGTIALSSNQIATTIEEQERTANQQAFSVSETTATLAELGAASRQSESQAQVASLAAQKALKLAENGNHAVDESLKGMNDLKEKVSAISHQITLLNQQTVQIASISELVSDMANQTNMLALNAAVEAVRAGEYGQGFAVVATEIRKLADQSQKSTEQINNLVRDIHQVLEGTIRVTKEGIQTVETGMLIAQKTASAFVGVTDAVNDMVLNNQQISLNIQQQVVALEQIILAMNGLNQGAKETAIGITQTRLGTQKLNDVAVELQAIIGNSN